MLDLIGSVTQSISQVIGLLAGSHDMHHTAQAAGGGLGGAGNLFFFYEIKEFINYRIDRFTTGLLGRTMAVAGGAVLSIMTFWIMLQGLRIITGKSRDSMMELVMNSLRALLIVTAATTVGAGGTSIVRLVSDSGVKAVYGAVTGSSEEDPYSAIDSNLAYMQLAMISIDALDVSGDETIASAKTRAELLTGVGIAGPALIGGTLLILNRIAMSLFVGMGPIFIMCLLFDQTKHLFGKWLMFGIGTMFSLGVLSVMVSLSLDIVSAVAVSFWVGSFLGSNAEGISSMALQQGGLGMIMTLLTVTVPPMAAAFFQGTLGQFSAVNMYGGSGITAAQSQQQKVQQTPGYSGAAQQPAQAPPAPEKAAAAQQGGNRSPEQSLSANNPVAGPKGDSGKPMNDGIKKPGEQKRSGELM